MAKNQKGKPASAAGGRNPERRNGKKWSRHSGKGAGHPGHRLTGRTKPSGSTIGGYSAADFEPGGPGRRVETVRESRNTRYRADLRAARKAEAAARSKR